MHYGVGTVWCFIPTGLLMFCSRLNCPWRAKMQFVCLTNHRKSAVAVRQADRQECWWGKGEVKDDRQMSLQMLCGLCCHLVFFFCFLQHCLTGRYETPPWDAIDLTGTLLPWVLKRLHTINWHIWDIAEFCADKLTGPGVWYL